MAKSAAAEVCSAQTFLCVSVVTELTSESARGGDFKSLKFNLSGMQGLRKVSMKVFSREAFLQFHVSTASTIVLIAYFGTLVTTSIAQEPSETFFVVQSNDSLPAPEIPAQVGLKKGTDCETVPPDPSLSNLSADIQPRKRNGEIVSGADLPPDCAKHALGIRPAQTLTLPCTSCEPSTCELLQLARFCHQPLYFDDQCLERYGVRSCCCQPAASACHLTTVKNDCLREHADGLKLKSTRKRLHNECSAHSDAL